MTLSRRGFVRLSAAAALGAAAGGTAARAVGAFARAGLRVEGAAAAGLAALPQLPEVASPVVLVVTGANIDEELWERAVQTPDSFPD